MRELVRWKTLHMTVDVSCYHAAGRRLFKL